MKILYYSQPPSKIGHYLIKILNHDFGQTPIPPLWDFSQKKNLQQEQQQEQQQKQEQQEEEPPPKSIRRGCTRSLLFDI